MAVRSTIVPKIGFSLRRSFLVISGSSGVPSASFRSGSSRNTFLPLVPAHGAARTIIQRLDSLQPVIACVPDAERPATLAQLGLGRVKIHRHQLFGCRGTVRQPAQPWQAGYLAEGGRQDLQFQLNFLTHDLTLLLSQSRRYPFGARPNRRRSSVFAASSTRLCDAERLVPARLM